MEIETAAYLAAIVQQLNIICALLAGGVVALLLWACYKFLRIFI